MWLLLAIGSACAAATSTLTAKLGMRHLDSDLANALRTIVVLGFATCISILDTSIWTIHTISFSSWFFLAASAVSTGISWLCYYKALSLADVSKVAPIDKSSTLFSILLGMILFQEWSHWIIKLIGIVLIGTGMYLMLERPSQIRETSNHSWLFYAFASAGSAALTSIFAKAGLQDISSNLATCIRTAMILVFAWGMVFARRSQSQRIKISCKELTMILCSGVATGISWLCYNYALQNGVFSVVVSIDKLSIVITIIFSAMFLKEKIQRRAWIGLGLLCIGTIVIAIWS